MSQKQVGPGDKKTLGGIGSSLGRSAGGAGGPSAPPGPGPTEQERQALAQRASSLGSRLGSLRSEASLSRIRGQLGDLDSVLSGLPVSLQQVRQGGYLYKGYLEQKVEVLRQQWQGLRQRLDSEAAQQSRYLVQQADALQQRLSSMGANYYAPTLDALERDLNALQGKVNDVVSTLQGTFDDIQSNAQQTAGQLKQIAWLQQQVAEASFGGMRPGENVVEGIAAQYLTEGDKDGPKGILYLTDQRLLFEQKEDVATKKVLFVTTAKERVQKLLLEAPIGGVQPRASESGALMWKKELLEVDMTQATVSRARFKLEGDSAPWPGLIGRIRTGEIAGEKVGAAPAAAAAPEQPPAPAAPTVCPTCGARLAAEIVRGMQSITCAYCGTVVRL